MFVNGIVNYLLKNFPKNWEKGYPTIVLLQVFAVFLEDRDNVGHFPDFWENTILNAVFEYNFKWQC